MIILLKSTKNFFKVLLSLEDDKAPPIKIAKKNDDDTETEGRL